MSPGSTERSAVSDDSDLEKTESATPKRLEKAREEGQIVRSRDFASFALARRRFRRRLGLFRSDEPAHAVHPARRIHVRPRHRLRYPPDDDRRRQRQQGRLHDPAARARADRPRRPRRADGDRRPAAHHQNPRAELRAPQSDQRPQEDLLDRRPDPARHVADEDGRRRRDGRLDDVGPQGRSARPLHQAARHRARRDDASDRRLLRDGDRRSLRDRRARRALANVFAREKAAHEQGRSEARAQGNRRRSAHQGPHPLAAARRRPPPHDGRDAEGRRHRDEPDALRRRAQIRRRRDARAEGRREGRGSRGRAHPRNRPRAQRAAARSAAARAGAVSQREIDREIPGALYGAVAQVLAWVYQLKRFKEDGGDKPDEPTELDVPRNSTRAASPTPKPIRKPPTRLLPTTQPDGAAA